MCTFGHGNDHWQGNTEHTESQATNSHNQPLLLHNDSAVVKLLLKSELAYRTVTESNATIRSGDKVRGYPESLDTSPRTAQPGSSHPCHPLVDYGRTLVINEQHQAAVFQWPIRIPSIVSRIFRDFSTSQWNRDTLFDVRYTSFE